MCGRNGFDTLIRDLGLHAVVADGHVKHRHTKKR